MKKVFLFLVIISCIFSCNTADNSKANSSSTDSSRTDTSKQLATSDCAPGDSNQIEYWKIDTSIANAMITHVGHTGKGSNKGIKYKRDNIVKLIKAAVGAQNFVGFISARYRPEDVERYRTIRCIPATDSSSMVADYFTNIVKVKLPKANLSPSYGYYDLVTIKPPPEEGSGKK